MTGRSRLVSTALLVGVFAVNYVETAVEDRLRPFQERAVTVVYTFQELEGRELFRNHELTDDLAVYGYSLSYFFVMLALALAIAVALAMRERGLHYRILALAVTVNYLISLPFFLFFPVRERWTHAESGAILLSDRWSASLIEALRPISGLDNCFPSSHTSLTVIIVILWWSSGLPGRHVVAVLGAGVVLSTFVLGIHWIPDIIAGAALGVLSVELARRWDRAMERRYGVSEVAMAGGS